MTPDPAETVHLSPAEIWYMYKTKILTYAGITAAVLVIAIAYQVHGYLSTSGSQELYAKAHTIADFQKVIQEYPGTPVAGNAALQLAEKLRAEKKFDEALSVLRNFVEKYPTHPLAPGGWTSIAATYEMQGKLDEALKANDSAISKYPDSYATPIAMMSQARIYLVQGKKNEARHLYEDVKVRYGQSIYAQEAARNLHFIKK